MLCLQKIRYMNLGLGQFCLFSLLHYQVDVYMASIGIVFSSFMKFYIHKTTKLLHSFELTKVSGGKRSFVLYFY